MVHPWNPEVVEFLKSRWSRDLVNRIVFFLNEGESIHLVLADVEQHPEAPAQEGRPDLRGIDLSHQNLRGPWVTSENERYRRGVDLARADLRHADLSWALMPRADLREALLAESNLDNSELIHANLTGSNLEGATLNAAWLLDTRIINAVITEHQLAERRRLGQLDFDYHAFILK